jgi:L-fucose dehydrogenase
MHDISTPSSQGFHRKLKDNVAIITGSSKGIGLGCARVFARHGWTVVLAAEEELTKAGHTALFLPCDVASESDLRSLIDTAVQRFGRLDCLVNNAG